MSCNRLRPNLLQLTSRAISLNSAGSFAFGGGPARSGCHTKVLTRLPLPSRRETGRAVREPDEAARCCCADRVAATAWNPAAAARDAGSSVSTDEPGEFINQYQYPALFFFATFLFLK
jgi:hypothetical protein